jgi:hypothetical protein
MFRVQVSLSKKQKYVLLSFLKVKETCQSPDQVSSPHVHTTIEYLAVSWSSLTRALKLQQLRTQMLA